MNLPDIETEEFAEFVGAMLGDGNLGIYKTKAGNKIKFQHRIKITVNSVDDIEYAYYLSDLMFSLFEIKPKFYFKKKERAVDVQILNKELVKFLTVVAGMELAPKYKRAVIPGYLLNNELELSVLRGLFDTDGCVVITNNNDTTYPRLEIKVIRSPMRNQITDILRRNGFRFILSPNDHRARQIRIQLNGLDELRRWMHLVGFSNEKHQNKATKYLNTREIKIIA